MKTRLILVLILPCLLLSGCSAIIMAVASAPAIKASRAADKRAYKESGMTRREWKNRPRMTMSSRHVDTDGRVYWKTSYTDGRSTKEYDDE